MNRPSLAAALAVSLAFTAASPTLADQPIEVAFVAEIAGKPFSCAESYAHLGVSDATLRVTDYRLFVQDPALVRADGSLQPIALTQNDWQQNTVALLDFEDGTANCAATGNSATNTVLQGTAPEGDYIGLRLTLGVPFTLNHIDPTLAEAPLNTTGMFWTWQNGFRFLRIDFAPTAAAPAPEAGHGHAHGGAAGWFLHLGSTQCASDSQTAAPSACVNPNRASMLFDDFDPAEQMIVIDPAPVVSGADLTYNTPETSPGCMSFPGDADCASVMPKLGLPYDGHPAEAQQLMRVR